MILVSWFTLVFIELCACAHAAQFRRQHVATQSKVSPASAQIEGVCKEQVGSGMRSPVSHPLMSTSSSRIRPGPNTHINIVHFNDVYNVEARDVEPVGGAPKFVTKVKELSKELNALVLFSGDAFNPSLMSMMRSGAQMPPVLNQIQVAAACVGNHELDFGVDRFEELVKKCNFPWLMANILLKKTNDVLPQCKRYVTLDWQGVKVGVMGLAEEDWLSTLPLIDLEDLIYLDYVEEARRICRVLREEEQVDLVVALTHMRVPNDMHLAAEVPGIDLVLGGHDHHYEVMTSEPNGTLVVKSGTDFREMTLLKVMLGESRPKVTHQRIEVTSDIPDDEETAVIVQSFTEELENTLSENAGPCATALDGRFKVVRTMECNLGNMVADIMRHSLDFVLGRPLDCTFVNGGTLRSDRVHSTRMLTKRDLRSILPMMDKVAIVEILGKDLLRTLEVSNLFFEFDGRRPSGSRIIRESVHIGDEPLDVHRKYVVGTKHYLLSGRDGFDCFTESNELVSREECPELPFMICQHFDTLRQVNQMLRDGEEVNEECSVPVRRLVQAAEAVKGSDCSAIARYFPEENVYMADPAMEGRIVTIHS